MTPIHLCLFHLNDASLAILISWPSNMTLLSLMLPHPRSTNEMTKDHEQHVVNLKNQ